MPQTDIGSAVASDLKNAVTDFSVDSQITDGPTISKGRWSDPNWSQYLGYYKDEKTPELTAVIDAKATWTVGKGYEADEVTTMMLDTIRGNGFDTFNSILENAMRTMLLGGNFYAEVINDDSGNLISLKPLDPQTMVHLFDAEGIFTGFEQTSKTKGKKPQHFKPEQMFYLARNRIADEMHGTGIAQKLKLIIDMKNEAMADNRLINHRFAYPKFIFHLDTDDDNKIAAFKAKNDKATGEANNMYVPKDAVVPELLAVAPNATINLLPWINYLDNLFYQTAGVPKIVVGGSSEFTEKASSIVYLAFQQSVEEEQLYIEEQVLSQLNLLIELEFPVSLENEMLSDEKKDQDPTTVQPNETTAGAGQ